MPKLPQNQCSDGFIPLINGEGENLTDIEELDQPSERKTIGLSVSVKTEGPFTDTEILNASDEDPVDDYVQGEEFVPELKNEVVSQTEGYKGSNPSVVCLQADNETDTVYNRHQRNLAATESLLIASEDHASENQLTTGSEDMDDSDDERSAEEYGEVTNIPEVYLEHGDRVSSAAVKNVAVPSRKTGKRSACSKSKSGKLNVHRDVDDGVTEEEELQNKVDSKCVSLPPTRRIPTLKSRRKKIKKPSPPLSTKKQKLHAGDSSDYETDSESIGNEKSDDEGFIMDEPAEALMTDTENYVDSGDELDMKGTPDIKEVPFTIPEPHYEVTKVNERPDVDVEVRQEDTDEEGFEIGEKEDKNPLPAVDYHKFAVRKDDTADLEDAVSDVCTDNDDLDFDDDEKRDILCELSTWRRAEESNILEKFDCGSGTESTIGKWKNAVCNVMKTSSTIKSLKMCLPSNLSFGEFDDVDSAETDEEHLNENNENCPAIEGSIVKKPRGDDESSVTSSESVAASESDIPSTGNADDSQLAELRFLETEKGSMNIIISPDRLNDDGQAEIHDNVPGVMFLEDDEDNATDEEIVKPSDDRLSIQIHPSSPLTDMEDFLDERGDLCRPETPIPHDIEYSVLSSPKRERIHIKEDKYGVPQVRIEKMRDDFLSISQDEDRPSTATEDVEITLEEALRIFGLQETEKDLQHDLGTENSEITAKLRHKITRHLSEPNNPASAGGTTDEEEVVFRKKRGRKGKKSPKQLKNDDGTDEEVLSGRDSGTANWSHSGKALPVISTDEDTDSEHFEVSAMEDIIDEPLYPMETPEIIRRAAVKRTEIYREGPNRTTGNVIIEPAQIRSIPSEPIAPTTDTEEMDASAAEDMYESCPVSGVVLQGEATKVTLSEEVARSPFSALDPSIRENLLYSNVQTNTDVESLDGVEGHRLDFFQLFKLCVFIFLFFILR